MNPPSYVLLYVQNPTASAAFYSELLGRAPVESSVNFAMFVLDSGVKLGLWASHDVEPASQTRGGGAELGFPVEAAKEVDAVHARWSGRGMPIAQTPTQMDFGYTFVALDPDGHRLRVFAPGA